MADADIPITAGSGTKVDTRTVGAGVDEHRQVVVIGDPTTAANVGQVDANGALEVRPTTGSNTGGQSSVAGTVTANTTLIAADSTRVGLLIYNDSTSPLTVLLGAGTQSSTVFSLVIPANTLFEVPPAFVCLRVAGAWATATGNARITAVT